MRTRSGFQLSKQPSKSRIIDIEEPQVLNLCKRRKTTTSVKETENGEPQELCEKNCCNLKELGDSCMTKWYPNVSVLEEEVVEMCPICCKNCNCKSCLTRFSPEGLDKYSCGEHDKIEFSKHILRQVFPLVTSLNEEQLIEKELEANIKGLSVTELQLEVSDRAMNEDINCGNCGAYIFDMHRSCACRYALCLVCVRNLRETTVDGIIRCPIVGCEFGILELKHLMLVDWVDNTLARAKGIYTIYDTPEISDKFCSWHEIGDEMCDLNHFYTLSAHNSEPVGMQHFQLHWSNGEPVLVNDVLSTSMEKIWEPMALWRAFHEITKEDQSHSHAYLVKPVNCENRDQVKMDFYEFLSGYLDEQCSLKLEDWQPSCLFEEKWPKQFVEFVKCLPFKDYTHPCNGYVNVSNNLRDSSMKLEMGPRVDICYKQTVTMLHCDKSDTVSVLTHITAPTHNDNENLMKVGAVWEIFRKQDSPTLEAYLREQATKPVVHPIHDRLFYLDEGHKRRLKHKYGIEPWIIKQKLGDAVFVPAGCPYQVRNWKSNTKVKLNYVSPESLEECIRLQHEFQALPKTHKVKKQMLNIGKMMIYALDDAVACLAGSGAGAIYPDEIQIDNEPENFNGNDVSILNHTESDTSSPAADTNEDSDVSRPDDKTSDDSIEDDVACLAGAIYGDELQIGEPENFNFNGNDVSIHSHTKSSTSRPADDNEDSGTSRLVDKTLNDSVDDGGVWEGYEVGKETKEVLQAVKHRYPTTYDGIKIRKKEILVPILMEFSVLVKGIESVLKKSVDENTEDQITALRMDVNEFEALEFDLSWARHRLDMVEELKHGNNILLNEVVVLDECLPTLKKKLVERTVEVVQAVKKFETARLEMEKAQIELDDAIEARNNKAREVAQKIVEASGPLI